LKDILSVSRRRAGVRVTRNTGFLVSGQLITALFVLLLLSVLGRKLMPEGFGLYRLAFKWAMCAGIILDFGSRQFVIREIAKDHRLLGRLVLSGLGMRIFLFLPILASFIAIAFVAYRSNYIVLLITLACTSISIKVSTDYLLSFFHGLERMEFSAVILPLQSILVYVASILAIVLLGAEPHVVFLFDIGAACLVFALTFIVLKVKVPFPIALPAPTEVWDLMRSCAPFAAMYIFGMMSFWLDTVVLSFVLTAGEMARDIGMYESVSALVGYAQRFPQLYAAAVYPVLVRELALHPDKVETILKSSIKILLIFSLPLASAWCVLAQPLGRFVYRGEMYDSAVPIAMILVWVLPLRFMCHLLIVSLNAAHCERINAWISVGTAICAILLIATLGHYLGARGAALGVVTASAVMATAYIHFVRKHVAKSLLSRGSLMMFPISAITALALWWMPVESLPLRASLGAAVCLLAIVLFGVISKEELRLALAWLKKTDAAPEVG
jgi:O-antigen/teichoic acid export membrane protein